MTRPESVRTILALAAYGAAAAVLCLIIALPVSSAPDRWLDTPHAGPPAGENYVEVKDDLEIEKIAMDDPELLWFRNGLSLKPAPGIDASLQGGQLDGIVLLQFSGRVQREWTDALAVLGITVHDHVQNHAMLVEIPEEASDDVAALVEKGIVRYVGPYPARAKIEAGLDAAAQGREERVTVVFFGATTAVERATVAGLLVEGRESEGPIPSLRGRVPAERVSAIAGLDRVKWIERYVPGERHNLEASMSGAADDVVGLGVFTGSGVRVAVDDSGITRTGTATQCGGTNANYHPDIAASRIADEWDFNNNDSNACDDESHGTHVAGTIGGDGTSWSDWTGIAPDVTFLIYKDADANGTGFGHFDQLLSRAASHDADIVANSWGNNGSGGYNINSQYADRAVRGNWNGSDSLPQRMFLTISTGNHNDLAVSPSTGKNVVAVGATKDGNAPDAGWCWGVNVCTNTPGCGCSPNPRCGDRYWPAEDRICFSNHGPVDTDGDGHTRVKPDVVAPGTRIMSLAAPHLMANPSLYRFSDGTSMSQPVVAGVAALMIHAYPNLRTWPEMAKARLLGTAIDLGDRNLYGHGMVDALHAVFSSDTLSTELWQGNEISATGAERDHTFTVPSGFSEVRVYLTWSDPDSSTTEVVNDLDLRVYDATGALVASSASYDDTVEYVRVTTGTPGTWRANVRGFNVPQPAARYGVYAGVVKIPASLSMDIDPNGVCVGPGDLFQVETTLLNSGHAVAASETVLDLPGDPNQFILQNVEMLSADPGRSHVYQAAEIRRVAATNEASLYLGQVHKTVPRRAIWSGQVSPSVPEGSYMILAAGTAYGSIYYGDVANMQVDATVPGTAPNLTSTTHPAGTCWNQTYIWMTWDPATDAGCGLDGYALQWSSGAAAIPFTVKDLEETETVYFESLAESTTPWYFNLRSVDNAGNWGPGYSSYGPMWVDATPPGVVGTLGSETHLVGSCTDNPDVFMAWNHAPDDNCGTTGYSVAWSSFGPALPDTVPDLEYVDSLWSTIPPSNEPRYFNILARDAGDNWGNGYVSYGPIWVDTIPGELTGLSLEAVGNDLRFWWNGTSDADNYRVYADTQPWFPSPWKINDDVQVPELWDVGGAVPGPDRILYYKVLGTNVCEAEGPI